MRTTDPLPSGDDSLRDLDGHGARGLTRRRVLATLGGLGAAAVLAACGRSDGSSPDAGATTTNAAGTIGSGTIGAGTVGADTGVNGTSLAATCTVIPEETAGPFPGDGSNGVDVLTSDGVVRADLRASFGEYDGIAEGVPLEFSLAVVDAADGCSPLGGAAVYAWHCDAAGNYSLYSDAARDQNYLRGVQVADDGGVVTFTTVFPGCYPGRWPHIHFEVFASVADATGGGRPIATSQLAFARDVCEVVYTDRRYPSSTQHLAQLSLETDMVFQDDGAAHQLAATTGSVANGYVATLTVAV